jgi:hypothetical protein
LHDACGRLHLTCNVERRYDVKGAARCFTTEFKRRMTGDMIKVRLQWPHR